MRELVEVSWAKDGTEEDPVMVKEKYYLLHFGLCYKIIDTENGQIGVNYTVCICQNIKTGDLEMFDPSQLRVLGTELKK
jgi:hypothetical protein